MSSRGASSPDRPGLVGTYPIDGGYVSVRLSRLGADRFVVSEERFAGPGQMVGHHDVGAHDDPLAAMRAAEVRVLENAGLLAHEAETIACAPLDPSAAEALLAPKRAGRFLHVLARPLAG